MKNRIILVAVLIFLAAPVFAQETGIIVKPQPEMVLEFLTELENAGLLQIIHKGEMIVSIDMRNGSIAYGKGYAADTAALLFWEAVGLLFPRGACK